MSIKLMTRVWEHGPDDRTETMVLLALADRANDDGTSCFPSVAEVSQRSRLSRRGTQKVIRRLEEKGYLTVDENSGPGGTNNYQLHPAQLEGRTEFAGEGEHDSPGGEAHSPGGEPDDARGRSTFARNRQEPSVNHQSNRDAPAREEGSHQGNRTALSIHQEWFPNVSLSIGQKEILKQIDDLDTWADVVEWWCGNGYKGRSISRMKQKYQERLEEERESILSPERQEDPRWSVDEQGRKCYDGVPIEEFNCPNLAADLGGDHAGDGTAGREPEVSAA